MGFFRCMFSDALDFCKPTHVYCWHQGTYGSIWGPIFANTFLKKWEFLFIPAWTPVIKLVGQIPDTSGSASEPRTVIRDMPLPGEVREKFESPGCSLSLISDVFHDVRHYVRVILPHVDSKTLQHFLCVYLSWQLDLAMAQWNHFVYRYSKD